MMSAQATIIDVSGDLDVVAARTSARDIARRVGFGHIDQARIATAVSELTRNIVLYAGSGKVTTQEIENGETRGIECTFTDAGPGIENVQLAMKEGFSTSGGMGMGLSGASRLMDEFHIQSKVGAGTRIVCRKWVQ